MWCCSLMAPDTHTSFFFSQRGIWQTYQFSWIGRAIDTIMCQYLRFVWQLRSFLDLNAKWGIVYLTDSNIFISLFTSNDYVRSLFILSMFRMINDQPATRGEENVVVCVQNIPNNLKVTACSTIQFLYNFRNTFEMLRGSDAFFHLIQTHVTFWNGGWYSLLYGFHFYLAGQHHNSSPFKMFSNTAVTGSLGSFIRLKNLGLLFSTLGTQFFSKLPNTTPPPFSHL